MGKILSFGLDRVLEHIMLSSGVVRRQSRHSGTRSLADSLARENRPLAQTGALGGPDSRSLPTGQRRILEHVVMMSAEKQLKMPR